jgi:hypothetical protein
MAYRKRVEAIACGLVILAFVALGIIGILSY